MNQSVNLFLTYIFTQVSCAPFPVSLDKDPPGHHLFHVSFMTQKLIIKVLRRLLSYRLNNHECLCLSLESPNPLIIPTVNLWTFFNSSQSLAKVLFVFANLAAYMAWEWVFHSNAFVPGQDSRISPPIILSRFKYLVC